MSAAPAVPPRPPPGTHAMVCPRPVSVFILCPQDNWICVGPHYAEHLAHTAPFNATRLLSQFPPGTRIFAEGNSWFGELILTLICTATSTSFWAIFRAFLSLKPPSTRRVICST